MKTKVKILISIIAICVIIGVVALSLVLVLTEPVHIVDNSNITINYTAGNVSANVSIVKEDMRLYRSQDGGDSISSDIGASHNFSCALSNTLGVSDTLSLGEFNAGQLIDKSHADSTLTIDVKLNTSVATKDFDVVLTYVDNNRADANVRLVVSAYLYKSGASNLDLGTTTYELSNGTWNMNNDVLFQTNHPLSKLAGSNNYTGVKITVVSEVVSYSDNARLDGAFNLSLNA